MNDSPTQTKTFNDVEALVETYLSRLRAGDAISIEQFADRFPQQRSLLLEALQAVVALEGCADLTQRVDPEFAVELEDYEVRGLLGEGGMGVVYRAFQISLGREVALKVLPVHSAKRPKRSGSTAKTRFEREAKAAAKLQHDHVVPIFEVGTTGETLYYAMQLIEGMTLGRLIAVMRLRANLNDQLCQRIESSLSANQTSPHDRHDDSIPDRVRSVGVALDDTEVQERSEITDRIENFSLPEAYSQSHYFLVARIGRDIARALHHAHQNDVIHRDVKPSNVLIDQQGKAWIADFGLAKLLEEDVTATGAVLGTPRYMAPEQHHGQTCLQSDLYSLGITLAETTVLRPLDSIDDQSPSESLLSTWLDKKTDRFSSEGIPGQLRAIIAKAIAPDPSQRFDSAEEIAEELDRYLSGQPVMTRLPTPRGKMLRRTALGCVVVLAALATGYTLRPEQIDENLPDGAIRVNDYFLYPDQHDSEVAQWVFDNGGMLYILDESGEHEVRSETELPDQLWNILAVKMHGCQSLDRDRLHSICALPALRMLQLNETNLEIDWMQELESCDLISLQLNLCGLTDECAPIIGAQPRLRFLGLNYCDFTDEGVKHFGNLDQLEELKLQGNKRLTGRCLETLRLLRRVSLLDIQDTSITDEEARAFETFQTQSVYPAPPPEIFYGRIEESDSDQ